jgi:hypothetical protein
VEEGWELEEGEWKWKWAEEWGERGREVSRQYKIYIWMITNRYKVI